MSSIVPLPEALSSQIAQEIYDIIIDFLHDNRKALASCSLVCKAWIPVTRHHIYSGSIRLHTWNSTKFLALLQSPHCTIARHIYGLVLDGHDEEQLVPTERGAWIQPLTPHFYKLCSVRSMTLKYIHCSWFGNTIKKKLTSIFTLLTYLSFTSCHFKEFEDLLRMLISFPNLKQLVVNRTVIGSALEVTPPSYRLEKHHQFRALAVDVNLPTSHTDGKHLVGWLLSHEVVPLTEELVIRIFDPIEPYIDDLVDYIRACDSTITFLELRFSGAHTVELATRVAGSLDLQKNVALKTFCVTGGPDFKGAMFLSDVLWPALWKIDSPNLNEITAIADEETYLVEEQLIDFTMSTDFFSRRSRPGFLRDVKFKLYGYVEEDAKMIQEYIKKNAPDDCTMEMSPPIMHMTYFERVTQSAEIMSWNLNYAEARTEFNPELALAALSISQIGLDSTDSVVN